VERVVVAVNHAMNAARRQLYVFATAAVRDAANRDAILDCVEAFACCRGDAVSGGPQGPQALSLGGPPPPVK
jgi:hypothetical protein